jgi:plastocyanin
MSRMRLGPRPGGRPVWYWALVVVGAIALVGCGSSSSSSGKNTTSAASAPAATPTTSTSPPAATGMALVTANAGGQIKFDQTSLSLKAGDVAIVMQNPSSSGLQHGIAVEGNGIDKSGPIVGPGRVTSTLALTLKPGTYTFYCPFDSHKAQGMKGTLTVK